MDSEKAKRAMTVEEDPIIDEELEEEMRRMEMEFKGMDLDNLVKRQQDQADGQNEGKYGNMENTKMPEHTHIPRPPC